MRIRLLLGIAVVVAGVTAALLSPVAAQEPAKEHAAAVVAPNIFFYNLDDLRDAVPGGVDPLQYMPEVRSWMAAGTRFRNSFVVDPACCPSRAALMTGRYPHNNGVRHQADGPLFDHAHSMACYLQAAGYRTYVDGKFLTTWPRTSVPPCFTRSTVMWEGYNDVEVRVDGLPATAPGYSTTYLGARGRDYIRQALSAGAPFLLYETPQAPHWVKVTRPDGSIARLAVPEPKYVGTPVAACAGAPEADRSDKPAYVRNTSHTAQESQQMCASQLRAIRTADDEFGATMQLLADRGVLSDTLVVFSSDNGYMWGEHGRSEKFVPYEPSIRVPMLLRWPGHVASRVNRTRMVSNLDLLPTMLEAAGVPLPAGAPLLDGESLLGPSARTTMFAEYYNDAANGKVPTWKMVRTATAKYVETYGPAGDLIFREYYNLTSDGIEQVNLLHDGDPGNDPSTAQLSTLTTRLHNLASCSGSGCVR